MKRIFLSIIPLLLIVTFILSACSVQAEDASLSSIFTPKRVRVSNCDYGGEIKSVEAVDQYTVKFSLCSPDSVFPYKMAAPIFAVQDDEVLNKFGGDSELLSQNLNTTGPFRVISNIKYGNLELYYSNSYWGITPAIDYLVFKFSNYPGTDPSIYELSNSDIYRAYWIKEQLSESVASSGQFTKSSRQLTNLVYLGFNNKIAPMNDQNVRQAIATLVNRNSLVDRDFPVGSRAANQVVPLGITGHSESNVWFNPNALETKSRLQMAKFDFSQELSLAYQEESTELLPSPEKLAIEIQSEFAQIGVKVKLKPMAEEDFTAALANGTEMMFLDSFNAAYPDGAAFYEIPFLRQSAQFGEVYTDIIDGLKAVQAQTDYNSRQVKFDELNRIVKYDSPLVPIGSVSRWSYFRTNLANTAVNGYYDDLEKLTNHSTRVLILQKERPQSLWPADETNYDTFNITRLMYDTLTSYDFLSNDLDPDLAEKWVSNADATEWTFTLRYGVKFTNGSTLDANDVVSSFTAIWNSADPNHKGRTGDFTLFKKLFGPLAEIK